MAKLSVGDYSPARVAFGSLPERLTPVVGANFVVDKISCDKPSIDTAGLVRQKLLKGKPNGFPLIYPFLRSRSTLTGENYLFPCNPFLVLAGSPNFAEHHGGSRRDTTIERIRL